MKVKVPATIKIATHSYNVSFRPHLRTDEKLDGFANHRTGELALEPEQPDSQKGVTLIHESIHIIQKIYEVGIDENDTERLAQGLMELLANNLGIELDWSDIT